MKTLLCGLSLLLCAISFVHPWEGDHRATGGGTNEVAPLFAAYLPAFSSDMSDLDARDAHNQPLQSGISADSLVDLFAQNLFALLVIAPSHAVRLATLVVEHNSYLFNELFVETSALLWEALMEVAFASKKRFVHNVNNLWITISVGVFAGFLLLKHRTSLQPSFSLPMRC